MKNNISKFPPILEYDFQRNSTLGYEPEGSYGFLRCLEHGAPNDLIRWHHHEEYELHLITETNGKMFVGDYIGDFKPGNLVLTGPRLPHNWISTDIPKGGVKRRDFALQFSDDPFRKSCGHLPELKQALPLLDRAKNGIEFLGISEFTEEQLNRIKNSTGIRRFNAFLELILTLTEHPNYQLLSNNQLKSYDNDESMERISDVVDYITENYNTQFSMTDIAKRTGMESSQFSRYFRRASGNTFTEFVNRLRINKACQLLMDSDKYISTICYQVGYNNVANFNRRFIEMKNMTPSDYRKQSKKRFH